MSVALIVDLHPVIDVLFPLKIKKMSITAKEMPAVTKLSLTYPILYIFTTDVKFIVVNPTFKKQLVPNVVKVWALVRRSVTVVKAVQPENAVLPILITLIEIVTEVKERQFRNALSPILVTLLGISGVMPVILTAELNPVIDILLESLKTKKAFPTALFKTVMEIPAVVKLAVV